MTLIDRFIPGIPKAQPRPRAFARKFGNQVRACMYDAGTSDEWKGCIVKALLKLRPLTPWDGPLKLDLTFYMPRPGTLNRQKSPDGEIPHMTRPDIDNLSKAVFDCLTAAKFIADDKLIVSSTVEKFYPAKAKSPGVHLKLSRFQSVETGLLAEAGR